MAYLGYHGAAQDVAFAGSTASARVGLDVKRSGGCQDDVLALTRPELA